MSNIGNNSSCRHRVEGNEVKCERTKSRDGPTTCCKKTQRTMIDSSPITHGGGNCGPMFDVANVSFFVIAYDNKNKGRQ